MKTFAFYSPTLRDAIQRYNNFMTSTRLVQFELDVYTRGYWTIVQGKEEDLDTAMHEFKVQHPTSNTIGWL